MFSIVSKDYKLIRHERAVSLLEKVLHKDNRLGRYKIRREIYNDGARIRQTYRFTDRQETIYGKDAVSPELHLFNSYDTTWPFTVLLGAFRFVCGNGLVIGKRFLHFKRRHVYELDDMGIDKEVKTALKRFSNKATEWRRWANAPLTGKTYKDVLQAMKFGKKAMALIEQELPETEQGQVPAMSLWQFYNTITCYITHHAASLNHRVELEKRLRGVMEGLS